jgi:hypothetical protein
MTAWPAGVDSAMVDDGDKATECLFDLGGAGQVRGHVLIFGFGTDQAAVEGIDEYNAGADVAKLRLDADN